MRHGCSKTRLYRIWGGMKSRCYNEHEAGYKHYGARGIKICDEWLNNFVAFRDWAIETGYDENAPRGQYTIERIDNDGPYSPENCHWATIKEQENNKRNNRRITIDGETKTLKQWCECKSVNYRNALRTMARREKGEIPREQYLAKADERRAQIRQAIKDNPDMSIRMLAAKTGFSKSSIQREKGNIEKTG